MQIIETRLSGRQASLVSITRAIHRQLGQGPLARVELRYSTQALPPLQPQQAKQAIGNLLRESGMGAAAISIRAHEGLIDDATAEHLLRLYPVEREESQRQGKEEAGGAAPRRGLAAWLARRFPAWFRARKADQSDHAGQLAEAKPARVEPALSRTESVGHLRTALVLAAGYLETGTGRPTVAGRAGRATTSAAQTVATVGEARIVVRLAALHAVLAPLVTDDAARAAQSIASMLKAQGLAAAPDFRVRYAYQPRQAGDGTAYASECDVEAVLRLVGDTRERVEPSLQAPRRDGSVLAEGTLLPCHAADAGTLLPASGAASTRPGPALTVRVLGTTQELFAQAFVLHFEALPARLDRRALEQAGLDQAHPGLLAITSNSCPLTIRAHVDGRWLLHANQRAVAGSVPLPMYFLQDGAEPITADVCLPTKTRLLVNAPGGVLEPATGRVLPALVLELLPGDSRTDDDTRGRARQTFFHTRIDTEGGPPGDAGVPRRAGSSLAPR